MTSRFIASSMVVGCCAALAGCSDVKDKTAADATLPATDNASVRYVPLDAPAGISRAVVVERYPLVHTRQLLPVDGEGQLAGGDSTAVQIQQVLDNLQAVLQAAGSSLDKLVKLNVYVDSPETADAVRQQLVERLDPAVRPAVTAVVSQLPLPDARIAVDAVAMASNQGDAVRLERCATLEGDKECADAAVMPRGGVVYLSGQPDKSPLVEATDKSLTRLLEIVDRLKLERSQIVQLKVFVEQAAAADDVLGEIKRHFPGQLTPPVIFVEWIASAPVEIEMIVHLPTEGGAGEPVIYYTPPGVRASPTFSQVAFVPSDRRIYISGLVAGQTGDGDAQVRDVFGQLKQILSATGSDLKHLAKATYYVSDDDASTSLDALRPEFYDPKRPPAASKVMVRAVGQSDRSLTIDMIAVVSR